MENLLKDILEKVTSTDSKVDKLLQWKAALDERCSTRGHTLDRICKTLYNNSNGGLVGKVNSLLNCKESIRSTRAFFVTILQKVITYGIIAIIIWLLILYKGH